MTLRRVTLRRVTLRRVTKWVQDKIDICMLLGSGWPMHLGGILPYLDREGISEAVCGVRFHPKGVASLP